MNLSTWIDARGKCSVTRAASGIYSPTWAHLIFRRLRGQVASRRLARRGHVQCQCSKSAAPGGTVRTAHMAAVRPGAHGRWTKGKRRVRPGPLMRAYGGWHAELQRPVGPFSVYVHKFYMCTQGAPRQRSRTWEYGKCPCEAHPKCKPCSDGRGEPELEIH